MGRSPTLTRPRIILAGGSGHLGSTLDTFLRLRGYETFVLTRHPMPLTNHLAWNASSAGNWTNMLEGADAVISLLGYSRDPATMEQLVAATNTIGRAIRNALKPPRIFVQSSSLDYYGRCAESICDETSPAGTDERARLAVEWEHAFEALAAAQTRQYILRVGSVFGGGIGPLERSVRRARYFLGGHLGWRRRSVSWVHLTDLHHMFLHCLQRDSAGVYNATSPRPVDHHQLMRTLRRMLKRPWSPPLPSFAVRMISNIIGVEPELALTDRRCVPARFLAEGFTFRFPGLPEALADVLRLK